MLLSEFDYALPANLIAQQPPAERGASRMLVLNRSNESFSDSSFSDLPGFLRPGDVLVLNNTRVFPARLIGKTSTEAAVEVFLIRELGNGVWETLARPGRRLSVGKQIAFGERLTGEVVVKTPDAKVLVEFKSSGDLFAILDDIGRTPLPPYIKRESSRLDADRERYQTVFAKERGAIAAPTAGLHFTPEMLATLVAAGITIVELTLHVGYGTFEPVKVDNTSEHTVSPETYELTHDTAEVLNSAFGDKRRIFAVGTTTTRALESSLTKFGAFRPGTHLADLTITPGYEFKAVDAMLTNFHLPQSSLLILTSTFGGHELIMNAYVHAVAAEYHFYSYGDCMLII